MNYYDEVVGGVFFIPLFLPSDIKNNIKNYYQYKFNKDDQYAFGRLIEPDKSSGDLVEIFNYIGVIPNDSKVIINSGQMFEPLHISLGFSKKRWRFIFIDEDYHKVKDSHYDKISFLLGDYDDPVLWVGGKEFSSVKKNEINKYNRWIVYAPTQLEEKIRDKQKK